MSLASNEKQCMHMKVNRSTLIEIIPHGGRVSIPAVGLPIASLS